MQFRGDADGVHLVGDWDATASWSPALLGEAAGHDAVRTTIKVTTTEGYALYRVTGVEPSGALVSRRIRRGRGKATS